MRGVLLAVDLRYAVGTTHGDQSGQGDLGGIAAQREHGFAKDRMPDRHHVEPARELPIDPGFHAVRVAAAVQVELARHDAPVAIDDTATTAEDAVLTLNAAAVTALANNDVERDGQALSRAMGDHIRRTWVRIAPQIGVAS